MNVTGCRGKDGVMRIIDKENKATVLTNSAANTMLQRRLTAAYANKKNMIVAARHMRLSTMKLLDDSYATEEELRLAVDYIGKKGWVVYYNTISQQSKTQIKP